MKTLALFLVSIYQRYISPNKAPSCRFRPTCSQYAAEAIERHGAMRGCVMAAHRVLRCHPWSKGGYDPVK